MKKLFFLVIILSIDVIAQPVPSQYYKLWQKDTLYYMLTDKALFKFYSHGSSGEFFLTNYIEGAFNSSNTITLNDDHLFLKRNDSVDVYSNMGAQDLTFESTFIPGYTIYQWSSLNGFGPYIFIRSGDNYNLLKPVNGVLVSVEDSLFIHHLVEGLFFIYPYVIIGNTVYKYIEGFDFYSVGQISSSTQNTGITNDTLVGYFYWIEHPDPWQNIEHSTLIKTIVEEPNFPSFSFEDWGINTGQLHCSFCVGTLIAKENLYYMTWTHTIVKTNSQVAYSVADTDIVYITDNYIFLLGDSVRYSKWYAGSTFYPFTWTDVTGTKNTTHKPSTFRLYQNYPNPFNPRTKIKYQIPELSNIKLTVYDVLGREVRTLVNEEKPAGSYEAEFNGKDLPSGVYFYRIETGKYSDTKKFVLLK